MEHKSAVLAVDDSATVRRTLAARLAANGMDVVTAGNGAEALARLEDGTPDVVLLDIRMPEQAGMDVLRAIRRRFGPTELPVIMLTVSEDSHDVVQALEAGANDYVIKPGELQVLLARIRTQVALKLAHARLREAHGRLEKRVVRQSEALEASHATLQSEKEYRLETEEELRASERRYRKLYDENPCMLFTVALDGTILGANRFGAAQLGFRRGELRGRSIFDLCHVDDRDDLRQHLAGVTDLPEHLHRWEVRKLSRRGEVLWLRETARVVEERDRQRSVLLVCEDVTETYRLSERLTYQTTFDPVTGLLNRTSLESRLASVLERDAGTDVEHALLYLDLDQFKIINDTCGHAAGDELLRQISQVLKSVARRRDVLARWGGDEFAVLLEDCPVAPARAAAEALRNAVETHDFQWEERPMPISASIGIVPITRAHRDPAAILSMADAACYAAKDSGRNRVHVYAEDDLRLLTRFGDMAWVTRINEALAENRFHLVAQHIAALYEPADPGHHFELLLRMRDIDGNEIPPGQFLPAAERYNMAVKIDRWVTEAALQWLCDSPEILDRLYLCDINLSGQSLGDEQMLEFLLGLMDSYPVPASKLCFEITETSAISDLENAVHFIRGLKDRGCRFAIDDFGSGLSSFAYLKKLPVDFLKIDGVFVRDIVHSTVDRAMVRSINEIGQLMGKRTIAEFAEDEAILQELRRIGVDYAQGYSSGPPQPIDELRHRSAGCA